MSGIIHGTSYKILHLMRDPGPTLAIYWDYIARANNDNVAWPSLKTLAKDTGWGKTAINEARQWLIDHQALEPVTDYTRPQWREKEPQELARLRNLDKAQYFRPTGYIVVDGKQYDLLYVARNQEADEPEQPEPDDTEISDVPLGVTSTPARHQPERDVNASGPELNIKGKALDITPVSPVGEQTRADEPEPDDTEISDVDSWTWRSVQKAVNDVFKHGNPAMYGVSGDIAHMMLGTAVKKAYAEYNFANPVTEIEVMAFGLWYGKKRDRNGSQLNYPTRPEAILGQFEEFRMSPDYRKHMAAAVLSTEPKQPETPSAQESLMAVALAAAEANHGRTEPDTLAA
jgi:hypothetical protein